ncbi:hypothetical protein [uncultured Algibacter sp.]|uniref:hypothetical protein n=1 Tax=uncultured Algibacter sp. TaxID=298659 RepID=UPI0026333609|nr:hypothetical protein [uncultured Algibacter sp.]
MVNQLQELPDSIYLNRLRRFIDIVYALIFFHLVNNYLPLIEDMEWSHKPYGLLSHMIDSKDELLRIFIGAGLTLMYWNQNNGLFKNLIKTNGAHVAMSLIQLFLVCLYVFFAIADPGLVTKSSPALQAGSLALAGFLSVWSWVYASKNNMINASLSEDDINQITRSNFMEPATAVVNIGLAFVGPMVWTLAWFVLPPFFMWILKKRKK